jgi:hypothetical protein
MKEDYTIQITVLASILASITYAGIAMLAVRRAALDGTHHRGFVLCFACGFPLFAIVNSGYDHCTYMVYLQVGLALALPIAFVARKKIFSGDRAMDVVK